MRETKWRMELFSLYDHTGIEAHLEEMAAKGWELCKINNFGWKYRRVEPKKLHFTVTHYPPASVFDPGPSEGEQTFQEFCAEAGWRLAASAAQLQIFCNEAENPVPIETDAALQVETIHSSMKKSSVLSHLMLLAVGMMNLWMFCSNLWRDPIRVLVDNSWLFSGFCQILLVSMCLVELFGYFFWYRRAKAAAELDGSFVETRGHKLFQTVVLGILFIGMAFWLRSLNSGRMAMFGVASILYVAAVAVLVNAIRALLKRMKAPAKTNRTVTIVSCFVLSFAMTGSLVRHVTESSGDGWSAGHSVHETYEYNGMVWTAYQDELPLGVEDLLGSAPEGYSREREINRSPVASQLEASQRPRMDALELPELAYSVTTVKLPLLYSFCRSGVLRDYRDGWAARFGYQLVVQNESPWEADAVYRVYRDDAPLDQYVIFWPGRIVEITFGWEPTPEQITTAAETLKVI